MDKIKLLAVTLVCVGVGGFILQNVKAPAVEQIADPYTTQVINDNLVIGTVILCALPMVLIMAKFMK